MSKRPPSSPPVIAGFDHVKLLGSGGFADVFLYQQQHPRRQVAVKVLLKERMGTDTAEGFTEEANLMAQLATHPSIVSVYQAGVSDDGRPYLVMEFCSKPNLQVRHRRERFSEAETLRVGVQIAGAVETAHRAGILHRDIKPANILVTDYGRPALTDFGISATTSGEMTGMSVPWSPPEAFRVPAAGYPSSDVYALAATLYTLLTNRSPFEIAGASNSEIDVISRIQSAPVPPIGRSDVSASLEAVLARAMAKNAADRYASAIEFARALQRVQIELGMQATTIDVVEDDLVADEEDDDDGRTRFRGITSIDAQAAAPQAAPAAPLPVAGVAASVAVPLEDRTVLRPDQSLGVPPLAGETVRRDPLPSLPIPAAPPLGETIVRAPAPESVPEAQPVGRRRRIVGWVIGGSVAVVAVAVVLAIVLAPGGVGEPETKPSAVVPLDPGIEQTVAEVTDLAGTVDGENVAFTWTNPDPQNGDTYLWRPVVPGESFAFEETTDASVTMPLDASGRTCVEVLLVRSNGAAAEDGVEACAP